MDRKILKLPFTLDGAPDWVCPTCQKAPLRIRKESFSKEEKSQSKDHSHEAWEPEWIEYIYSCMLLCANDQCKEVVASGGTGSVRYAVGEDENGQPAEFYDDYFRPKFFVPNLKLLHVPENCADTAVASALENSFVLFFAAPHAALSSVRIAIESLLTELKVRRFNVVDGKQRFINLHQRIALLPGKWAHLKEMMLAIKWLGNAGSHNGGKEVTHDDVLDAYELTEHILQEVYAPKLSKLAKLAKKVNKKKGPAS